MNLDCPFSPEDDDRDHSALVDADVSALLDQAIGAGKWGMGERRRVGALIHEHGRQPVMEALQRAIVEQPGRVMLYIAGRLASEGVYP